jgi:hypothetical protein
VKDSRRILFLFPDEWDHAVAAEARHRGRHEFFDEGFDLFSFPDNLRLATFDALAFVERIVRRYRGAGIDAVATSDEQFGPFLASLIAERLGLAHAPLQAILTIQHKYYARQAFERIAPEANLRFGLIRRRPKSAAELPLPFPFYVKPAKAAFSVLARRVDTFEELRRHTDFGLLEGLIIRRLLRPFGDVMRAYSAYTEHPFSMVAEEVAAGRQVTANGYVREGRVTMLGTVDSIMYPGTDQFQRFQYPSSLPAADLARIDALAARLVSGLGFDHGMFNMELRVDPATGRIRVIEINPRAAGQFYDLFERVDGYSLFEALLALECGEEPIVRHRAGEAAHAASFVLRDLGGAGLSRWPGAAELARLRSRHPGVRMMFYPKRGAELKREIKWLGSYRYAVLNMGAASLGELFARFAAICDEIGFHPNGHKAPSIEALVTGALAGD